MIKRYLSFWSNPAGIERSNKGFMSRPIYLILFILFLIDLGPTHAQCDQWTLVNDSADWVARAGLQTASLGETFYLMGGRTPKPPSFPVIQGDSEIWNDVWKSTDKGATWTRIHDNDTSSNHWPARGYFQAVTKNDSMFILGGQNYNVFMNPVDSSLVSYSDFFNDVWSSTDGVSWTQLTDSAGWSGRAGLSAVVYRNEIYVMGGSTNDDAAVIGGPPARIYYNDVWKSADGKNWVQVTDSASWSKRAGGIAVVKDDYIYMIGGEVGFLCLPGSPCPPYFNDVWRTKDGANWELVRANAPWSARPGHQVVVANDKFVLFGGFGLNPIVPIIPANPVDIWVSETGESWDSLVATPWNAFSPTMIKYDFDALVAYDDLTGQDYIYTFGGDRETFNFQDPLNHLNIDNDVWKFCANGAIALRTEQQVLNEGILVYPNPVNDRIVIYANSDLQDITLYDVRGVKIFEKRFHAGEREYEVQNMNNIPAGLLILKVTSESNKSSYKLSKQ